MTFKFISKTKNNWLFNCTLMKSRGDRPEKKLQLLHVQHRRRWFAAMLAKATGHPSGLPPASYWSLDQLCVFSVVVVSVIKRTNGQQQTEQIELRKGRKKNPWKCYYYRCVPRYCLHTIYYLRHLRQFPWWLTRPEWTTMEQASCIDPSVTHQEFAAIRRRCEKYQRKNKHRRREK